MKYQFCVLLLACWWCKYIEANIQYGCPEDFCQKAEPCKEVLDGPGRLVLNATLCGCCHVRMTPLKEGDACNVFETTPLPSTECGKGLVCDAKSKTCAVANTKCNIELATFKDKQEVTLGPPKPNCDEYGEFEAVQCKKGMTCFCVDRNGNRLFGEGFYTEQKNMSCKCSREYNAFLKDGLIDAEDFTFLRCDSMGNYDGPQCTENYCYCIDMNGTLKSQAVDRSKGPPNLPCFEERGQYDFMTPCVKKLKDLKEQIANSSKDGITIVGVDLPSCDPDGSYSPKQCNRTKCYCANRLGVKIDKTEVERYSQESKDMKCNCIRHKEMIKYFHEGNNQFTSYICWKNGNYLPVQCTTSVCYCVDEHGYQTGQPMMVADRRSLKCYNPAYEEFLLNIWS